MGARPPYGRMAEAMQAALGLPFMPVDPRLIRYRFNPANVRPSAIFMGKQRPRHTWASRNAQGLTGEWRRSDGLRTAF